MKVNEGDHVIIRGTVKSIHKFRWDKNGEWFAVKCADGSLVSVRETELERDYEDDDLK